MLKYLEKHYKIKSTLMMNLVDRLAQSVQRLTTGWTVQDRIPVGTIFSARPDRQRGLPSLLYNGYRVFPRGRGGRGVRLTPTPSRMPRS